MIHLIRLDNNGKQQRVCSLDVRPTSGGLALVVDATNERERRAVEKIVAHGKVTEDGVHWFGAEDDPALFVRLVPFFFSSLESWWTLPEEITA